MLGARVQRDLELGARRRADIEDRLETTANSNLFLRGRAVTVTANSIKEKRRSVESGGHLYLSDRVRGSHAARQVLDDRQPDAGRWTDRRPEDNPPCARRLRLERDPARSRSSRA